MPPLSMDLVGGMIPGRPSSSPSLVPSGFTPVHVSPADHIEGPLVDAGECPKSHTGSPVSPLMSAGALMGPRPGPLPLQQPPRPLTPFMPPFPNSMPLPNMPRMNIPPVHMNVPQGPVVRDGPPGRFRMPMPDPYGGDFYSRDAFPPHGPMDEDPWEGGPFRDDWQDYGPNRGPEWFGEEPPFRRGGWGRGGPRGRDGWGRGGPRGRGHFGNR